MKIYIMLFMILMAGFCKAQKAPTDTVTVNEGNFKITWSHSAKYPVIVSWRLTSDMLNCPNPRERLNSFRPDPALPKETDLQADYLRSGFDRGHNFNAADNACSDSALNIHCWYYTNMSPQLPKLNRGTWKNLEEQCRKWVRAGDELSIKCGSFGKLKVIGPHKVWIPAFCWKIIKHKSGATDAYLMPNDPAVSDHPFAYYHTDITVIRQKTGFKSL